MNLFFSHSRWFETRLDVLSLGLCDSARNNNLEEAVEEIFDNKEEWKVQGP